MFLGFLGAAAANPITPGHAVWSQMLIMFFLFLGMWFILIAPQRKRQKKHDEMVRNLKHGDRVLLSSGFYGEITNVRDDRFEVRISDNTVVGVHKSFVSAKL
ncbi:MAG: preprotein translocase subunit YajC [Verrucomicrobiota bacterium]|nr:MAG: preprotein translocase subunit YajC [Verrucomicrobiota bacterium]